MKFSKKNKLRKNSKRKKIKQKNKGGASTEGEISNKIKDIIQSIKYLNRPKENLVESDLIKCEKDYIEFTSHLDNSNKVFTGVNT